ncbi:hypothetical protein EDD18DRAFT_1354422 [Armillaria luteobubalina]|uniref:Uncharacterized protein n=1 Tax=Armillaria luteobubalina TaxID=153913 RepID=A0AA39USA4_9AGAR|nr:hypothetical protein EDD18DRAFT_1354422 [Armillaria luteobubalina]
MDQAENDYMKRRIEEDGVDLAVMAVDILKAAAATSIPALGAAAGIVSSILQQISQAQQNTELALKIAARCARTFATISKHLETLVITSAVLENIESFEENLYKIQDFIEKETSNNIFYSTSRFLPRNVLDDFKNSNQEFKRQ